MEISGTWSFCSWQTAVATREETRTIKDAGGSNEAASACRPAAAVRYTLGYKPANSSVGLFASTLTCCGISAGGRATHFAMWVVTARCRVCSVGSLLRRKYVGRSLSRRPWSVDAEVYGRPLWTYHADVNA